MIELTEQQCRAVKQGDAIRVLAPDIGADVVILNAAQYEMMKTELEDKREQKNVLNYSMKQAAKAAQENPF